MNVKTDILLLSLALAVTANAQNLPRIGYVYPAGGQQGANFQITLGGQFLDGAASASISGDGVEATVIQFNKPMGQGQFNQLRDKLRELQDRKQAALRDNRRRDGPGKSTNVWTAADEEMIEDFRARILKNPPNRNATPAVAETVTLKVTIATDAEPGEREIRLGTPNGLSNPLVFCVGELPEFTAPLAQVPNPEVDRFRERLGRAPTSASAKTDLRVTLPAVANGQIMPGEVDHIRFAARKGQRIVMAVSARSLIPYLADAVPGWFQATVALFDAKGKELAYADDFRFNPDPVLSHEIPVDGEYVIEIKDAIYRGREDFVYRISVGELPFITSIFPLGVQADKPAAVQLAGWNLSVTQLKPDLMTKEPGIHPISLRQGKWNSNRLLVAVDTLPEVIEKEPNDQAKQAQAVQLPIIINGRINQPGDSDVFRFEGRAGDAIVAEVHARRLNSPLDSVLRLTDAAGRQLAFNDDCEDKGAGLHTHHADSRLTATLPADGTYRLHVSDAQRQGGPELAYRLRVSPPKPDFELRVVPSTLNVRSGASIPITVFALRKDGFTNEIALTLKDAPPGFKLSGNVVPAGQDNIRLTLTAPPNPAKEPFTLSIEGRATVAARELVRPVVTADDLMQAFFYRHLVPAKELKVAVNGRGPGRAAPRIVGEMPVRIPMGGTARLQITTPPNAAKDRLQLELSEPPAGITIRKVSSSRDGTELVLQSDAAKVRVGLQGNLIVQTFTTRTDASGKARPNQRRVALGALPAIPFEIVRP
ncbi:MAG: PPC domain-containing protein [Verrucomicrobia bacterium]|nr:PPC domain-containing protein [Verrucomicrobiota bacterium]